MPKTLSRQKLEAMKRVFMQLNNSPPEIKEKFPYYRIWDWTDRVYENYDFAIEICNSLINKLNRETERVKKKRSRHK